jgi:gamma-glutamylcyclotransferase (GGCT)/AIG2-like uncharacterized protein YtfP
MRFFFIGSWTEGMLHFEKLRPFVISYEIAAIKACAYRLPIGFPVLVSSEQLNAPADEISGQLVELQENPTLLSLMDTLNGVSPNEPAKGLNIRTEVLVKKLSNGESESAQAYFFNPKKLGAKAQKIEGGVWQQVLKQNPPLTEQLTERQITYVLKLGAAKGRDIVPINDLSLYRELIKLDLIVDKGRRLALSSLGKDVYNHLI